MNLADELDELEALASQTEAPHAAPPPQVLTEAPESDTLAQLRAELEAARAAERKASGDAEASVEAVSRAAAGLEGAESRFEEQGGEDAWQEVLQARKAKDQAALLRDRSARKLATTREELAAVLEALEREEQAEQNRTVSAGLARRSKRLTRANYLAALMPLAAKYAALDRQANETLAELDRIGAAWMNDARAVGDDAKRLGIEAPAVFVPYPSWRPRYYVGRVLSEMGCTLGPRGQNVLQKGAAGGETLDESEAIGGAAADAKR